MLEERPSSGYDLLKHFDQAMAYVWPGTQSQLDGELAKLQTAELIRVQAEGPRGRTVYEVTEAGSAELRRWLLEVKPPALRATRCCFAPTSSVRSRRNKHVSTSRT